MFTEINKKFRNYYKCVKELDDKLCNTEWEDEWDCTCDDRCPKCNTAVSPYKSEDIEYNDTKD